MSFRGHLRPGQGFKMCVVQRRTGGVTTKGRAMKTEETPAGTFLGIISQASQNEVAQWKQNGHPITHTIVQRGNENRATAGDFLELPGEPPRRFLVQGVQDPGELGHFTVYHVEERLDKQ